MLPFMRTILPFFLLALAGCDMPTDQASDAMRSYTCTTEQMTKAQNEAHWCVTHTDFLPSYCLGTAIIRNCRKRVDGARG